jgi:hypothetical protein
MPAPEQTPTVVVDRKFGGGAWGAGQEQSASRRHARADERKGGGLRSSRTDHVQSRQCTGGMVKENLRGEL